MNLFKKAGVALASLAMLAATAIPAAAEESYMKLLTVPVSEVTGYNGYLYNGIGIFNDGSEFWRIDTQQWRESGEISYSEVSLDDELQGRKSLTAFSDTRFNTEDDYAMFYTPDGNGNISQRFVIKYDEESNSLETVSTYDGWCGLTDDGYVVTSDRNEEVCTVRITSPNGTEKSVEFKGCGIGDNYYSANFSVMRNSDKYIVYVLNPASVVKNEEASAELGYDLYNWNMELYGIDRNGNTECLFTEICNFWGSVNNGANYCMFTTATRPKDYTVHVYLADTDEVVDIDPKEGVTRLYVYDGEGYGAEVIGSLGDRIYSSKAIAYADSGDKDGAYDAYALIDVKTGEKISESGTAYLYRDSEKGAPDSVMDMKYMSTKDGKMYLVQTGDDKWGFMSSNGKVLRVYDDAGPFVGDYAPVVKDGKAFLVDRNLNRVSEQIDADSVSTIEENLFWIRKGDEYYFMTFSNEMTETPVKDTAEPTEEPVISEEPETIAIEEPEIEAPEAPAEPAPAESVPTANTAANKGNPDTGAAVAVIPLLIAGAGTAVLTRKRK